MIRMCGLEFNEDEVIKLDTILRCHPQLISEKEEILGIPLRLTVGYQCIYDKLYRIFQGLSFYTPVFLPTLKKTGDNSIEKLYPMEMFSYVLASYDGTLRPMRDGVCLSSGNKVLLYSNFKPIKTSGPVKKGAIIGYVGSIPNGIGHGVTIMGYQNGKIWDIQNDFFNVYCME